MDWAIIIIIIFKPNIVYTLLICVEIAFKP